jgi:hypothetical protein
VARDAKLTARITAEDDASKVIDKVAAKAEELDKPVEVRVDADVARVLGALEDVTAEAKATAEAADVLGRALGPELAAQADTTRIVGDLRTMGLTLDQIKGNADTLAASLKQAADADLGGSLGGSLGTARGKADELADSARGANSALANMIGNSAQDLGALSGVAGSAGVALGQMAEYAADAKLGGEGLGSALKSMVAVAGPIAAMAAVMQVFAGVMAANKAEAEAAAARVKQMGEAMADAGDDVIGIADSLRETSDELRNFNSDAEGFGAGIVEGLGEIGKHLPLVGGLIGDAGQGFQDLTPIMNAAGLSMYDFADAIEQGGSVTGDWQRQLSAALKTGKISEQQYNALSEAVFEYSQATKEAAAQQDIFKVSADEVGAILKDLAIQDDPMKAFAGSFKVIMDDIRNGGETTEATTATVNRLAAALGIPPPEVLAMALEQVNEEAGATAEAEGELAAAVEEAGVAMLDAAANSEAFASALEQINSASDLNASLGMLDTVESFDTLKESLEAAQKAGTDWSKVDLSPDSVDELKGISDELAGVTQAVAGMREPIQAELQAAFDTGGIDAYSEKADFFAGQIRDQMPAAFQAAGASADEAATLTEGLLDELELLPADKEIMIRLTREEEARNALEAFSTVISQMPTAVQVAINTMIAEGDIEGALATLNDELINRGYPPIVLPVDAEPSAAEDTVAGFVDDTEGTTPVIPLDADDKKAAGEVQGFKKTAEGTNPIVPVSSDVKRAVDTMIGLKILAAVLAPVVHIMGDPANALAALRMVANQRPQVPVTAYLRDYPSAGEIAARIGVVRVPVDAYIRTMPRINGAVPG